MSVAKLRGYMAMHALSASGWTLGEIAAVKQLVIYIIVPTTYTQVKRYASMQNVTTAHGT